MWIRAIFGSKTTTADIARDRLRLAIAHQRAEQKNPDFAPRLRHDMLQVLRKYVNGHPQDVRLMIDHDDSRDTLEFSVVFRGGTIQW
jgi:cell division topological specificity factor